jgi:3D (Asp-Asp-Asp) domain-containing protein
MISPFIHNRSGPLAVDELVRVYKVYKDGGIVFAKTYDATTVKDMNKGIRCNAVEFFYIGQSKKMKEKWGNEY